MTFKNKLSDLDAIRPFIDKGVAISVSPLLSDIINESFTEGVFPDSLMIARVIPLFKSGKWEDLSNNRPISALSFVSKVFEMAMYSRRLSYCNRFDIVSDTQLGIRKRKIHV